MKNEEGRGKREEAMVKKVITFAAVLLVFGAAFSFGQSKMGVGGTVEWDKMELSAAVSLDLAMAGIKLPTGRTQGEALIAAEYVKLIRPLIMNLQVDSSSNVEDLIDRGEWDLLEMETLALHARSLPPALSPDFSSLIATHTIDLKEIIATQIRHVRPAQIPRTLSPIQAPAYTGIVIIASDSQPVHGRQASALLRPCLFPKIWDTEMNLIFEKNMMHPKAGSMVKYFPPKEIFAGGPSGLSGEIAAVVGDRPLRIFARGVFGSVPTDPIISRDDALLIISSESNRSLLREGKVAIILDDSLLKSPAK